MNLIITGTTTMDELVDFLMANAKAEVIDYRSEDPLSLKNLSKTVDEFVEKKRDEKFKAQAKEIMLRVAKHKGELDELKLTIESILNDLPPELNIIKGYGENLLDKISDFNSKLDVKSLDDIENLDLFFKTISEEYKIFMKRFLMKNIDFLLSMLVKLVKKDIISVEDINSIYVTNYMGKNYKLNMISKDYDHISFVADEENNPKSRYGVSLFDDFNDEIETLAEISLRIKSFLKETIK